MGCLTDLRTKVSWSVIAPVVRIYELSNRYFKLPTYVDILVCHNSLKLNQGDCVEYDRNMCACVIHNWCVTYKNHKSFIFFLYRSFLHSYVQFFNLAIKCYLNLWLYHHQFREQPLHRNHSVPNYLLFIIVIDSVTGHEPKPFTRAIIRLRQTS